MTICNYVKQVHSGEIDIVEQIAKVIEEIKKINKEYNYFNIISEESALEQAKELAKRKDKSKLKLVGVPVSVKDCICVKDVESRAGSKILNGYKPVFDATVIKKAKEAGAIIIGKTSQDEFGFGSFSLNVGIGFNIPLNPLDKERVCGGSSGGSAGITAKITHPHISIAESTGGSIACPAAFCGISGLTPTYGRVSRYGLMDYANSLDKIGTMAKNVEDSAYLLEIISGFEDRESTSLDTPVDKFSEYAKEKCKGMKVGIIKEAFGEGVEPEVGKIIKDGISKLEKEGVKVEEVSLPLTMKYSLSAYYLIAMSEASTNLAKYCGMRYGVSGKLEGNFNEYFSKIRSENFGTEAKRRIMLGTFARMAGYRDAYYLKALSVRTKIIQEYKKVFKRFDAIVSPTMPFTAPRINDVKKLTPLQNYMADIMTVGPNVAGLPHISVKAGESKGMPVGIMFISDHLMEKNVIRLGSAVEVK